MFGKKLSQQIQQLEAEVDDYRHKLEWSREHASFLQERCKSLESRIAQLESQKIVPNAGMAYHPSLN